MGLRSSMCTPTTVAMFCPHSTKAIRRLLTGWSLVRVRPEQPNKSRTYEGPTGPLIVPGYTDDVWVLDADQ